MTDDWKSGPKKPKATFGDVMRNIPAGQGGQERPKDRSHDRGKPQDRPNRDAQPPRPRTDRPPRAERPPYPAPAPQAAALQDLKPFDAKALESKSFESKPKPKANGPLVVIRRAPVASASASVAVAATVPSQATATDSQSTETSVAAATILGEAPESVSDAPMLASPEPAAEAVSPPAPHVPSNALFDDVTEHQSFAEMYEATAKTEGSTGRKSVRVGERVKGKIFQLGADTAFISLGGKSEAMIALRELQDDEGILRFGVGDEVDAHVIEAGAGGIILSKALAKGSANLAMLAEARASGIPVEGRVAAAKKGGFDIEIGDVHAFCPVSQIDLRFVDKPEDYVGQRLQFKVTELKGKGVVLSRRALLEEQQKVLATETRKNLVAGKVMSGKVVGVREFGAFVDLGGLEGLIPTSELSHARIGHPSELVQVGDEVEIEVLRIEAANPTSHEKSKHKERITLSMRSRQEDPWNKALAELKEDERRTGKVVRLQPFGAFVELMPGVDGLIHISGLSNKHIRHPKEVVNVGDQVEVVIEKIDAVERRVGLRLASLEASTTPAVSAGASGASASPGRDSGPREAPAPRAAVGQLVNGTVDRIESYGVFLKFPGGRGLLPASETGTERGADLRRTFQIGQELKACIIEMDATGKIRLSLKAAEKAEERADVEAWSKKQKSPGAGKGFGTFADLFKAKT